MRVLLTFSMLGILVLSGCSRNTASRPSKSELEQTIKGKLATEPQLATAIVISVDPDKNEVVLTGDVPTESLRIEAVQCRRIIDQYLLAHRGIGSPYAELVEQIGGTVDVRSEVGTIWTLMLPVSDLTGAFKAAA